MQKKKYDNLRLKIYIYVYTKYVEIIFKEFLTYTFNDNQFCCVICANIIKPTGRFICKRKI